MIEPMEPSIFNDLIKEIKELNLDKYHYIDANEGSIRNRTETTGEILTNFRLQRGYTQKEISTAINIAQQTYAGYERGAHEPTIEILCRLADVYGVSLDLLAGRYFSTNIQRVFDRIEDEIADLNDHNEDGLDDYIKLQEIRQRTSEQKQKYNRAKKSVKPTNNE